MANYWGSCPLRLPAVSKRGVEIEFIAGVYSTGGPQLAAIPLDVPTWLGEQAAGPPAFIDRRQHADEFNSNVRPLFAVT